MDIYSRTEIGLVDGLDNIDSEGLNTTPAQPTDGADHPGS